MSDESLFLLSLRLVSAPLGLCRYLPYIPCLRCQIPKAVAKGLDRAFDVLVEAAIVTTLTLAVKALQENRLQSSDEENTQPELSLDGRMQGSSSDSPHAEIGSSTLADSTPSGPPLQELAGNQPSGMALLLNAVCATNDSGEDRGMQMYACRQCEIEIDGDGGEDPDMDMVFCPNDEEGFIVGSV